MTIANGASVLALPGATPSIDPSALLVDGARVIGDVAVGERASIWYNAVVRGDVNAIRIGARSNVQDNVSIHVDGGHPAVIGEDVSIGHNAVVHGCAIGDGSLIGMGAVVLSGAAIGESSLVAAGAVVLEGTVVPPRSLVAGVPGKVRRELTDDEIAGLHDNARRYLDHAARHARAEERG
ncbi:gamma carbonic anhydrase family protein [Microbacterium sediminis]|uniref:Gamma carbonic anhydrase family protein n=1 Tax=Microbacterium sediminis TaxID=904291 RepID=A0A1B9NGG9_9MICO|nr:gamma carbonic anhydrase family protein [Microbacterium sediminis]OCG75670.1 gamma carbonic anhydrase family protein [Microbacterium sediminis]QBR74065.1 gamma carbonic anhydrase family protein [Microbacterium sediminis]